MAWKTFLPGDKQAEKDWSESCAGPVKAGAELHFQCPANGWGVNTGVVQGVAENTPGSSSQLLSADLAADSDPKRSAFAAGNVHLGALWELGEAEGDGGLGPLPCLCHHSRMKCRIWRRKEITPLTGSGEEAKEPGVLLEPLARGSGWQGGTCAAPCWVWSGLHGVKDQEFPRTAVSPVPVLVQLFPCGLVRLNTRHGGSRGEVTQASQLALQTKSNL